MSPAHWLRICSGWGQAQSTNLSRCAKANSFFEFEKTDVLSGEA